MAKPKKYYSLRAYASYLKRYKYRFLLVASAFVVADAFLAVIPVFIGRLVSALAAHPIDRGFVYQQAGFLILCNVGHSLVWHLSELLYIKLLNGRSYEFGNMMFQGVIKKPYPYFVDKFTGKISSYVSDLGREYRQFVTNICYNYIGMLVKMPAIAIIMFSVNIYTGLVFLMNIIVMFMVGRVTIRRSILTERKFTDKESSLNGYIVDVIANFVSVKAFRQEKIEADHVSHKRRAVIVTANRSYFWAVVFWGSLSLIVRYIIWPGTIIFNLWLFLNGHINLAQITTFTTALVIFSDYIWGVIWNIQLLNLQTARIEEAYRYLFGTRNIVEEQHQSSTSVQSESVIQFSESLELHNLHFAYPDNQTQPVLENISLQVSKNEKIGIVGHSGSGKTTLIKLLLGYYELPEETILVDRQPTPNKQLVSLISYVPQDTTLFHRTIAENIAYGADGMPERAAIELAAERAYAHEFIQATPKGYDTMVGEKGIKLSMGQRQRVAIARAFLDNKPLLILDEATSALDSESEALVQRALEDLWHDKTVIAIAHRLSTLRHMDRIVVMDKGRIVEAGTHQELLKKRGNYHRLWQHQHSGLIGD